MKINTVDLYNLFLEDEDTLKEASCDDSKGKDKKEYMTFSEKKVINFDILNHEN